MSPAEFRAELTDLTLSQSAFARECGIDPRSVRRWANDEAPIPNWVITMLRLMRRCRDAGLPTAA